MSGEVVWSLSTLLIDCTAFDDGSSRTAILMVQIIGRIMHSPVNSRKKNLRVFDGLPVLRLGQQNLNPSSNYFLLIWFFQKTYWKMLWGINNHMMKMSIRVRVVRRTRFAFGAIIETNDSKNQILEKIDFCCCWNRICNSSLWTSLACQWKVKSCFSCLSIIFIDSSWWRVSIGFLYKKNQPNFVISLVCQNVAKPGLTYYDPTMERSLSAMIIVTKVRVYHCNWQTSIADMSERGTFTTRLTKLINK